MEDNDQDLQDLQESPEDPTTKVYTKQEALDDSLLAWTSLAKSGSDSRPLIQTSVGASVCPLCTYSIRRCGTSLLRNATSWCKYCPLYERWGKNNQLFCTDPKAYYRLWLDSKWKRQRRIHAKSIVRALQIARREILQ